MSKKFPWYTARGDDGTTGLLGEGRVPKYHPQPEAFGTVDEVNAGIGLARAHISDKNVTAILLQTQRHCYQMMAELAAVPDKQAQFRQITDEQVAWISQTTDEIGAQVTMPREFVVPGDSVAGAALDMARTIVRRAERRVAQLLADGLIENQALVRYLNRLSSLLFVLGRYVEMESAITYAKDE